MKFFEVVIFCHFPFLCSIVNTDVIQSLSTTFPYISLTRILAKSMSQSVSWVISIFTMKGSVIFFPLNCPNHRFILNIWLTTNGLFQKDNYVQDICYDFFPFRWSKIELRKTIFHFACFYFLNWRNWIVKWAPMHLLCCLTFVHKVEVSSFGQKMTIYSLASCAAPAPPCCLGCHHTLCVERIQLKWPTCKQMQSRCTSALFKLLPIIPTLMQHLILFSTKEKCITLASYKFFCAIEWTPCCISTGSPESYKMKDTLWEVIVLSVFHS